MKYPRKVYAIRHNVTNRVYVGSSANVDVRFAAHISALRRGAHPVRSMQEDFNKHGDNYTFTILDTIENISENAKEHEWMKRMRSDVVECGYNYQDQKWKPHNTKESELLDLIDSCIDRETLVEAFIALTKMKLGLY